MGELSPLCGRKCRGCGADRVRCYGPRRYAFSIEARSREDISSAALSKLVSSWEDARRVADGRPPRRAVEFNATRGGTKVSSQLDHDVELLVRSFSTSYSR